MSMEQIFRELTEEERGWLAEQLLVYFWDKTRQERIIAGSKLEWAIVRPGVLTHGARRGASRRGRRVGGSLMTARVSRADVAEFMLDEMTSDEFLRTAAGVSW